MLTKSKFSIFCLIGVSTCLFSGCFTSFSTLQSSPATRTVYVMEEHKEDGLFEVHVYDQWLEYTPVIRPRWTPYVYYGDPMVDVCIHWPSQYWIVQYDPWWDVHSGYYFGTMVWHPYPYSWGGYHHGWHPTYDYYSPSYAWHHQNAWSNYHSTSQYPKNYARRSFDERKTNRRSNRRPTQIASRNPTPRTTNVRSDNNTRSGSLIKKSGQTGRSIWEDRNPSSSKMSRTDQTVRQPQVGITQSANLNTDRRENRNRSETPIARKPKPNASRISSLQKDPVSRTPTVSSLSASAQSNRQIGNATLIIRSASPRPSTTIIRKADPKPNPPSNQSGNAPSVSRQNNRPAQASTSGSRSVSSSRSTTITPRPVKTPEPVSSPRSESLNTRSSSLRKSTLSQVKSNTQPSSSRSSGSTSSVSRSSSVQKSQSRSQSNSRSSSSNATSNTSSSANKRTRR